MTEPASWDEITQPGEDTNPGGVEKPGKRNWFRRGAKGVKTMAVNRTVWVMAAIAVVSLIAGIAISQFVISPSQAAAETAPPDAGPITVPIELRELSNDIVARGDVVYDDAVKVTLGTADLSGSPVVTGAVPKVGQILDTGSIALEVVGRPVIVLPGELPAYRTLVAGASGPDVNQLRQALRAMGFDPGEGDTYDAALAGAVQALYAQVGYSAPAVSEEIALSVESAQEGVTAAEENLAAAEAALASAGGGPTEATRIAADNAVNQAARALDSARACAADPPSASDEEAGSPACPSIADAEDALRLAQAERNEALQPKSNAAEVASRDAAATALNKAYEQLATAQSAALTPFPMSEVVFFSNLPRRVDSVDVVRGQILEAKPAFSVSGANLEIVASLAKADADLIKVGDEATIELDKLTLTGKITKIGAGAAADTQGQGQGQAGAKTEVTVVPDALTEEQRTAIAGTNVKLIIPVGATEGKVLVVPVAALTAGAGGETRIEVLREGAEDAELVVVQTGLTAKGFAELIVKDGTLKQGDLVVVGNTEDAPQSSD